MKKANKAVIKHFDFFLKDFESDPEPKEIWEKLPNGSNILRRHAIDLPPDYKIYDPYIIFIILCTIKKFPHSGKWEKVAWEIPIKFKGVPFLLAHRKFGFRIDTNHLDDSVKKTAIEAIRLLKKAIPFAEKIIEPQISLLVKSGKITLDNEYEDIDRRYLFFRKLALNELKYAEKRKQTKIDMDHGTAKALKSYEKYLTKVNAINYYATAMLDSFFSLLEHTFVLLLPFHRSIEIQTINVEEFIGLNWKEKFKVLFPLSHNKEALKLYEELNKIKEEIRNPLTHGYFLKNGNSFYVHMDSLGAIPMTLTKPRQHIKYAFHPSLFNLEITCILFDKCMEFFENQTDTKFGMKYIQRGIPIAFDANSSKRYKAAMVNEKKFKEYIEHNIRKQEDAINMDW